MRVLNSITDVFQCKVCFRVTLTAFIAIVVVEIIVLIPSCQKFLNEWKKTKSLQTLSAVQAIVSLNRETGISAVEFSRRLHLVADAEGITGWRIIDSDQKTALVVEGAAAPEQFFPPLKSTLAPDNTSIFQIKNYFDALWTPDDLQTPYYLLIRLDASGLKPALYGYIYRIAGLVVIISLFVTFAVMIALKKVIFSPVLTLRHHLNDAKRDLQKADEYLINTKGDGEIGDLYSGFNSLLIHIVESFQAIKQANASLQNEINEKNCIEKELRESKKSLLHLASYDELTGLPNRRLALEKLTYEINASIKNDTIGALLFVDLDNFKEINDTLGHVGGDELLCQAANRMISAIRLSRGMVNLPVPSDLDNTECDDKHRYKGDLVARIGGDEFMVILSDVSREDIESVADCIQKICAKPFLLQGNEAFVTTSIGITLFPQDSRMVSECLSLSDIALYTAKELGRNCYCFFTPAMMKNNSYRLQISRQLRYAIENNELELHYQPIINLESQSIVAVEALLRWNNAELGSVPPDQFIPVAESTGLIIPIGEWVLVKAFERCRQLNDLGSPVRMAINVSPKQFKDHQFVVKIKELLSQYKLPPELIELEITESLLIEEQSDATDNINELSQSGVRLSIDDFGVGYSSLSYLSRFPVNTLKIDRSFVSDIVKRVEGAALIKTIIDMGKNFKLEIIAEGVESEEHVNFLIKHGCDQAQGFFFAKPAPFNELLESLETNSHIPMCLLKQDGLASSPYPNSQ